MTVFQELAKYREQSGLPSAGSEEDNSTIAKLEMGDRSFFGINSGSNPNRREITLKVNLISRTHAEADAFQQAFELFQQQPRALPLRVSVGKNACE